MWAALPGYDQGQGRRRWRALDLGTVQAVLEADAPRVRCPAHGVVAAAVPWAVGAALAAATLAGLVVGLAPQIVLDVASGTISATGG